MWPIMAVRDIDDDDNLHSFTNNKSKIKESLEQNGIDRRYRKDFILDVFDLVPKKVPFPAEVVPGRSEMRKSFRILRFTMNAMGTMPLTINKDTSKFEFKWKSIASIHCLITASWLTTVFICSCVGLLRFFADHLNEEAVISSNNYTNGSVIYQRRPMKDFWASYGIEAKQLLGILVVLSCVCNAWVQSLTCIYNREKIAFYMNNWTTIVYNHGLNPLSGLRLVSSACSLFLFVFGTLFIIVCFIGVPSSFAGIMEAFARVVLMVPNEWFHYSSTSRQVIRMFAAVTTVHSYIVHKTTMLVFATNSKLLANSFECWRNQLKDSLRAAWNMQSDTKECCKSLSALNDSHRAIVTMLRRTEGVFAPILEFFYASSIVSMCAMLYFIASMRGGLKDVSVPADEYLWQGVIIGQFVFVFVIVTLSASNVHVQSERCYDVIRRGLPFEATESDKHFFAELVRSITLSHLAISGNRFFDITKPFLLTIVGVILSYFIIILQLQNP